MTPVRLPSRVAPPVAAVRSLAAVTLVNTAGDGLFAVGGILFFIHSVGLSAAQVGFGLTAAGIAALVVSVPMGRLADRLGPRRVLTVLLCTQGVVTLLYLVAGSYPSFQVVAVLFAIGNSSAAPARGALVAQITKKHVEYRVASRAFLRSVTNVGLAIGTLIGGALIGAGTAGTYDALMVVDAGTYLVAALLLVTLVPATATVSASASSPVKTAAPTGGATAPRSALRDRPYVVVTVLSGVISLQYDVLPTALPLWVALQTDVAKGWLGPLLFANTIIVILFQQALARGSRTADGAALAVRRSGLWFVGSCALFALSYHGHAPIALLVLFGAVVVHSCGELLHAAGGFGLSFGLGRDGAHGEYQAVFGLGIGASRAVAPLVLTGLVIGLGVPGWILLAALLFVPGLAMPAAVRWAQRDRTREDADTADPDPSPRSEEPNHASS